MPAAKYETVYPMLKKTIGALPPGSRLPPIRELMRQYDVSQITIDKALKLIRQDGVIESIPGKGTFTRGEITPATLRADEIPSIAILVPAFKSAFCNSASEAMNSQFADAGWQSRTISYDINHRLDSSLGLAQFSGLVYLPPRQTVNLETLEYLHSLNIPYLVANLPLLDVEVNSVCTDNFQGGRIAAEYLHKCGYHHIGIVVSEPENSIVHARINGFTSVVPHNELLFCHTQDGENSYVKAYDRVSQELEHGRRCEAYFVLSDDSALGVLKALHDKGLDIPGDVGVIGFDGSDESAYYHPALTSIGQNYAGWADAAATLFKDIFNGLSLRTCRHIIIPPKIVVRDSVKKLS